MKVSHPKLKETDIQEAILEALILKGYFVWRNNNTPIFDTKRQTFRRMPKYSLHGIPDINGLMRDGRGLFIEVKRPGGKLTTHQNYFINMAISMNAVAFVADSLDSALIQLEKYE